MSKKLVIGLASTGGLSATRKMLTEMANIEARNGGWNPDALIPRLHNWLMQTAFVSFCSAAAEIMTRPKEFELHYGSVPIRKEQR